MDDTELDIYIACIVTKAQAESDAAGIRQAANYAEARKAREDCLEAGGTKAAAEACYDKVLARHTREWIARTEAECHQARLERGAADKILYSKGLNS